MRPALAVGAKGPGQVIVGAGFQPGDAVFLRGAGRDEQERRGRFPPQGAAHEEPAPLDFPVQHDQVGRKIAAAADPVVRFQYEESRRALGERLANLEEVDSQLERTEALYASLASALESTLTEVIRVQTLGPAQAQERVPDLVYDLAQRRVQLREFANRLGEL